MRNDTRKKTYWPAAALILGLLVPRPSLAQTEKPNLWLASGDGSSWISFHLALQFRWEYLYKDTGAGRASDNRIRFARIRPVVKGSLFAEDLTYLMHINLTPGLLELMDLWFDYRFSSHLRIKTGQMKIPFTRYRLNSFADRPVLDWSQPTRYFGAERQVGIMLHNGRSDMPAIEYELGLYTGINMRAANGVGMSKVYAEPALNPSSLVDPAGSENMHSEAVGHIAYNFGGINVRRSADLEGGPPRFSVGLSGAWDLHPTPRQDLRLRIAPEASFRAYGFALDLVFHLGWFDQTTGSNGCVLGMTAGVAQASYVFSERYEIALRYTFVHLLADLRDDARAYAVSRIESAGDAAELARLYDRYREVGLLQTVHETNLGLNIYRFGPAVKWQVDLGLLVYDRTDDVRYDFQLRTQMQLSF
jgi:hypothetical protein